MRVFIDTGAFLALADEDDEHHESATLTQAELRKLNAELLTSNFVLSETYTIIRLRVGHSAASSFIKRFDTTGIKVLHVTESIERSAKAIFLRHNDKDFSFVDCTSFVLIDHHQLDHAFAFDSHFHQFRFKKNVIVLPVRSLAR